MRILLAGASGFLGTSLREQFAREGHEVVRLVRGEPLSPDESRWDPRSGYVDPEVIEAVDVVINVAGSSFVRWPFTEKVRQDFLDSRAGTTRVLAEAIARSDRKPAFLSQSGTDFYGDHGDEVVTEDTPGSDDGTFLNSVTKPWEAAALPASEAGARVCLMRTSFVLDRRGGFFRPLLWAFRVGLGGPAGSGKQWAPTISLNDWVRAVAFLAADDSCSGPYNLTGPGATTNEEFMKTIGRLVRRPAVLRLPARPMKLVVPEMAPLLLGSIRAEPERLLAAGFVFEQPTIEDRVRWTLEH